MPTSERSVFYNNKSYTDKVYNKAIAEASNAGPHIDGMTDMVDLDNSIFYGNLIFITALAVTLDV